MESQTCVGSVFYAMQHASPSCDLLMVAVMLQLKRISEGVCSIISRLGGLSIRSTQNQHKG
eukprot:1067527-Amphidinium_carterae.1